MATVDIEYPELGITVTPGRERIHIIDMIVDAPDARIFEIDMHTKYAEPYIILDDEGIEVHFGDGSSQMRNFDEHATKGTILDIKFPSAGHWNVLSTSGRYTVVIALYRQDGRGTRSVAIDM